MKTQYRYIMLPIVLIALLAALSVPVSAEYGPSACPCVTKYTGTINGDIYYKYYGGTFSQSESTVFTDVPDGIITAKIYTGVWGGSPGTPSYPKGGTFQIKVNGHTSPGYVACDPGVPEEVRCNIVNEPECRDSVTGCNVHHITYDATPYIVSGNNTVTVTTNDTGCSGSWDGRIYFIALLVVHEDALMPEITYWINEGAVYMDTGSGCSPHADEAFIYFNGTISPASVNNVEYWTYGEPYNLAVNPDLNGINIGAPDPDPEGRVKWNHIPPAYLDASSNLFYYYDPTGTYTRAQLSVLILEHGEPSPDTTPPYTTGHNPAKGATDIPLDTNITVHVRDDGTGVNQSTIVMRVEGSVVTAAITGTPADYTLTYDPPADFDYGQVVDVTVDASDLNETPNAMPADPYSFTIMELEPSTPFLISGWVNNSAGNPVNNPLVNVTNTNTTEVFTAEATADSNHYQVLISSENVGAGNVLHFYASDNSNVEEFDHTVTGAEMDAGGFEENITIRFPYIDLLPTAIKPYHYVWTGIATGNDPFFNLTNYVNVTVNNTGSADAGSFKVKLYADDELIGEKNISLAAGSSTDVKFEWKPTGEDPMSWVDTSNGSKITYTPTDRTYTLKAAVDEANEVPEENETNNNLTRRDSRTKVVWNGYAGDEPLQNYINGSVKGGMLYTTGDGAYQGVGANGTTYGTYYNVSYDLDIPGTPELSRLYIYYTWAQSPASPHEAPKMGVTLTTPSGAYALSMDKGYNDYKGEFGIYRYPWGTYAYNITGYVPTGGTYKVSITNLNNGSDADFATKYAFAAPAILVVYENASMPMREYWINEGADILLGGRRSDGGYLAWWECMNNATFPGSVSLNKATLGIVSPWADSLTDDEVWFNDHSLGRGIYCGYGNACTQEIDGLKMVLGSGTQVSINASDVTSYLAASNNRLSQADDGDNMMPANAFLLVEADTTPIVYQDDVANKDIPVSGTVTGNYTLTHASDNKYEAITELAKTTGAPAGRISYLEHKWTINVTSGTKTSVVFYVEANHTANTEGDDFVFAYSTDDSIYTDMVTVTKTADDGTYQTYGLPVDLSGTVYIRVRDTDRTAGRTALDTIRIDHLFIRSEIGPPSYGVTVTIDEASRTVAPGEGTTYTVRVKNTGDLDASYSAAMSGTAVDETTIGVVPLNWNTGTLAPNAEYVQTVTVSTAAGTPETTYTLTAAAACDQDASVTGSATSDLVVSSATNAMHIASIGMSLKTAGPNINAIALVTIVDAAGAPVAGATVAGHWSGATSDTDSGVTGATGEVALSSDRVKSPPSGTVFTFTVDGVSLAGWTYDYAANVETSDSIKVP